MGAYTAETILDLPIYADFVRRYAPNPELFIMEVCGTALTPDQLRLCEMMKNPKARVSAVSGTGCFGLNTPVMRYDGKTVMVQDVEIGDMLMGDDGTPRNVLQLARGREEMYRFHVRGGAVFEFNASHILTLVQSADFGGTKRGAIVEMTVREYLALPEWKRKRLMFYKGEVDSFGGKRAKLPIPPYILGLWLGDGYTGLPTFSIADQDTVLMAEIERYAASIGCTVSRLKERGASTRLRIVRGKRVANPFAAKLKELGILNNKKIPDCYLYADKQSRLELLAGLIDTDGYCGGKIIEFVNKDKAISDGVAFLANTLGMNGRVVAAEKGVKYKGSYIKDVYYRAFLTKNLEKIPVKTERRKASAAEKYPNRWYSIQKVEPLGMGDFYGFELDGNYRFMNPDCFVLHNTGKTRTMAALSLWHLLCFPIVKYAGKIERGSNTYIGAPVIQQVKDGVWKEMKGIYAYWKMKPELNWLAEHVIVKEEDVYIKHFKGEWFITSFALKQGQAVSIAGKHRYHQMILIDEAAGVADAHYKVINGTQTQPANRTMLVSQGVKTSGFFYESHHSLSKANGGIWDTISMSSIDSPFADDEWIESVEMESGGADSAEYRIRVLGQFAENENENLLTRKEIEEVIGANADRDLIKADDSWGYLMLVDVGAGEYRDETICTIARVVGNADYGKEARRVEFTKIPLMSNSKDIDDSAGIISEIYQQLSNVTVYVDVGGIGMALAKKLEKEGLRVKRVQWGNPCFKKEYKERFFNQRACAMVRFRDAVRQGRVSITLPMDRQLREKILLQGSRLPYEFTDTGSLRYKMWSKDRMRQQGIKSPDIIDTFAFAFLEAAYYNVADSSMAVGSAVTESLLQKAKGLFEEMPD